MTYDLSTHICLIDQRRPYDRAYVCEPCRRGLHAALADILDLYVRLPDKLIPGASGGELRVSGSRDPQAPLNLGVLDQLMPAHQGSRQPMTRGAAGLDDDQVGDLSVATELQTWCRDWAEIRREHEPEPYVASMVGWLDLRADWACDEHPAVDEFATGLRELVGRLRGVLQDLPEKPTLLGVPCPSCSLLALCRQPGDDRVHCGACGRIMERDLYERLISAKAADLRSVA